MKHGQRILCIWLPHWPLQRLAAAQEELKGRPVLLYEVQPRGGGLKVVAYQPVEKGGRAPRVQEFLRNPTGRLGGESPFSTASYEPRLAAPQQATGAPRENVRQKISPAAVRHMGGRRTAGIQPGMPLAEALALHEFFMLRTRQQVELHLEAHDPLADRLALKQLADECQRFSPTVGLEESQQPDCLLLDVTGLAALFGGEAALAGQVAETFAQWGFTARVTVANTVGAAWGVAHYAPPAAAESEPGPASSAAAAWCLVPAEETLGALAGLPLAALRLPQETLALLGELGIAEVEQLCRLPRSSLHARFGPQLVRRLDQACGTAEEVIDAHRFAAQLEAEWLLEHPADRREAIEIVLRQLLPRVIEPLAGQRKGVLELLCQLQCETGQPWQLSLGLFRASASIEHLLDMLRLRLESIWLRSPIAAVRVAVAAEGWLDLQQQELFAGEPERNSPRQLAGLVDRLTSRLGRQAVLRPALLADAQPEHACQYLPLAHAASGQRRVPPKPRRRKAGERSQPVGSVDSPAGASAFGPGERPLRLHMPPAGLSVVAVAPEGPPMRFHWQGRAEPVARFWGPERIETGWWRTRCVRRDYYRVETADGQRFWLFRRLHDGRWFLQGTFD